MTDIVILVTLIILGIFIFKYLMDTYNRLVMLNFNTDKAFANIDVVLMQRAEEIPNLVKLLNKHIEYEKSTLEKLTQLRVSCQTAKNQNDKVAAHNEMTSLLGNVLAVAENYPELRSSESFLGLQKRVSKIEDIISDRREFFNESVNLYNIGIHQFPDLFLAKIMSYKAKSLLIISEQEKHYDGI
ncbi:LemA family protein [Colwellia echini]|uniref:LemA family protein n=1 Tax=Colwellia echini TaxID=1982103 RepID=A0ABY3MW97_9GAMM|nr:LemA family protein [Colwellia echini]TYK65426.1 LemA family protein [Colwellia echini]